MPYIIIYLFLIFCAILAYRLRKSLPQAALSYAALNLTAYLILKLLYHLFVISISETNLVLNIILPFLDITLSICLIVYTIGFNIQLTKVLYPFIYPPVDTYSQLSLREILKYKPINPNAWCYDKTHFRYNDNYIYISYWENIIYKLLLRYNQQKSIKDTNLKHRLQVYESIQQDIQKYIEQNDIDTLAALNKIQKERKSPPC